MTGGRCLRGALVTGALALGLLLTTPAHAADGVNIDYVETGDDGSLSVLLGVERLPDGAVPELDGITVTVDGEPVEATAETVAEGEIERTTVLTLDASLSMVGAPIKDAKAAAKAFLEAAPPDVQVGLVTFSGEVQDVIAPTTDRDLVITTIQEIVLTGGTRVYDAVIESAQLTGAEGARSVLLLTDGQDQGGGAPLDDAIAAAGDSGVVIDVVALDQTAKSQAMLGRIANASGGNVIEAEAAALESVFADQADALADQVLITLARPDQTAEEATIEVSVPAGGATYVDSAFVPLTPTESDTASTVTIDEPLVGKSALMIGAAALGLGLASVLGIVLVGGQGPSQPQQLVAAYLGESAPGRGKRIGLPESGGLKESAVALTSTLVKGDFESRLFQKLSGAGLSLTAAEWVLLHAGIVVGGGFVGFIFGGGPLLIAFLLFGVFLPWLYLSFKHRRRLKAFSAQLAETLTLMSGGLSAGLSLPQAVDTVVREGQEPMAGELRRALIEARLGIEIEEGLDGIAERMQSKDFSWVVMAIRIQREVGGNLAELLNTVAETLRERQYLRRQVRSLSAEGRLSGYILTALPIGMFVYLLVANRDYVRPLYTELIGLLMLGAAGLLLAVGGFFMAKLAKVEI